MTLEPRRISVFDSTLRDGEQAPGNSMRPDQKLTLALTLEALGVNTIEAGFPSSSPSDYKATQLISKALRTAKFATLNRADRKDISLAAEAGGVVNHQLQIMASGSDVHLEHKRGIPRSEGVREIADSVKFARSLGFTDITLGIEDATRGVDELLRPLIDAAMENGATTVALADTTGCMYPSEFGDLVSRVRSWIPSTVVLSTHCHDDLGLSLPNALWGDNAFATQAGIHQAEMLRNPITYEYVEPEKFGRARAILIGRHSGRNVIRHLLRQLNRSDDEALLKELHEEYIMGRVDGECVELTELHQAIRGRIGVLPPVRPEMYAE